MTQSRAVLVRRRRGPVRALSVHVRSSAADTQLCSANTQGPIQILLFQIHQALNYFPFNWCFISCPHGPGLDFHCTPPPHTLPPKYVTFLSWPPLHILNCAVLFLNFFNECIQRSGREDNPLMHWHRHETEAMWHSSLILSLFWSRCSFLVLMNI